MSMLFLFKERNQISNSTRKNKLQKTYIFVVSKLRYTCWSALWLNCCTTLFNIVVPRTDEFVFHKIIWVLDRLVESVPSGFIQISQELTDKLASKQTDRRTDGFHCYTHTSCDKAKIPSPKGYSHHLFSVFLFNFKRVFIIRPHRKVGLRKEGVSSFIYYYSCKAK